MRRLLIALGLLTLANGCASTATVPTGGTPPGQLVAADPNAPTPNPNGSAIAADAPNPNGSWIGVAAGSDAFVPGAHHPAVGTDHRGLRPAGAEVDREYVPTSHASCNLVAPGHWRFRRANEDAS